MSPHPRSTISCARRVIHHDNCVNDHATSAGLNTSLNCIHQTHVYPNITPVSHSSMFYGIVALAPMVRSGELPCRLLALKYGADLVWGPETVDRAVIGTTRRYNPHSCTIEYSRVPSGLLTRANDYMNNHANSSSCNTGRKPRESIIFQIDPELETRPHKLIFQLGTASLDLAVQAALHVIHDVAGIDINAGCPKPFSVSGGMGAALLRTPYRLCEIARGLVEQIGRPYAKPISVKIRLLETERATLDLVRQLCSTGISALTVHCRTTSMRPRESAIRDQLRAIAIVCHSANVACIMNGDIQNRDHAFSLFLEYGTDSALIATAAEKNPSVFRTLDQGGLQHWSILAQEYLDIALRVKNRWGNTKFCLSQIIPGKSPAGRQLALAHSYEDIVKLLNLDNNWLERARATTHYLRFGYLDSHALDPVVAP